MALHVQKITTEKASYTTLADVKTAILEMAKDASKDNVMDAVIELDQGSYGLSAPVTLSTDEEPNLAYVNITLKAKSGMRPSITSNVRLDSAKFEQVEGKPYYKYQFEKGEDGKYPLFHELYVNGKMIPMARSKNFRHPFALTNEERDGVVMKDFYYLPEEDAKMLTSEPIGNAEMTMYIEWECQTLPVLSVDFNDTQEHEGKKYVAVKCLYGDMIARRTNRCLNIVNREVHFNNALAYLTEPNTFVYNWSEGALYYLPEENVKLSWLNISYPVLENLLILKGLKNFTLEGITFTGATSKYICENGYCSGQANYELRAQRLPHAAILTYNMRNFTMRDCTLTELGGNGLLMKDSTTKANIYDNKFIHIGMTALSIGNPTTAWEKEENRNFSLSVINNYFHRIAYEYPTAVAVYISMVDGLKLMYNTMEKTAYSAISVGWGWALVGYPLGEKVNIRDAEIAYNKIIDYMDYLRDGAAIYVLGANCHESHAGQFNFMHDNYAERTVVGDASKRGYYMDGSSSNWEVYDNVTIGCVLPIFSQFHVPSQFTHHNYIHDIYSTHKIDEGNHAPWRDTILGTVYDEISEKDALLAAYPEAVDIMEAAGCDLDV